MLSSDGSVSAANRDAVRCVSATGRPVVLATGRIPAETIPYYRELGLATPLVCYHGALVLLGDDVDGERLLDVPVDRAVLRDLVDFILAEHGDAQLLVGTRDRYVINRMGDLARHWDMSGPSRPEVGPLASALEQSVYKLCYYCDDLHQVADITERVARDFAGAVVHQQAHAHLTEFLAPGVSKASGVDVALRHLGCDWADTLAIGDYFNDIEMLRRARIGVAMAGAPDAVQAAADAVTAGRDEDGVAAALKRFL
jgi:Cof subfamily protein (haloacid dehalogenase superfamily)